MTRHLIRASNTEQFQQARRLVEQRGQTGGRVLVESERRLYLSVADLPDALLDQLRADGLRVTEERPAFTIGGPAGVALG
jgi:hypothetical protein